MSYRWKLEILRMRAQKMARLALRPSHWKDVRAGIFPGLEHTQTPFHDHYDWVYDAGASNGQFSSFAVRRWPGAKFRCFEPIPECARRAQSVVGGRGRVHEVALSNRDEQGELIISGREDSSSMLPVDELSEQVSNAGEVARLDIDVRRLENYLTDMARGQNLLKIDVQGLELEVLEGAGRLLDRFVDVYCECSFRHLYQDQPLVSDVVAYMQSRGFELISVENMARNDDRLVLQADMLFRRNDHPRPRPVPPVTPLPVPTQRVPEASLTGTV